MVFSIVGFPADVREATLGEHGALAGCSTGGVLVDMTTSQPALAEEIARAAAERGVTAIDAPVSGGDVGARERHAVDHDRRRPRDGRAAEPCWQAMGSKWVWQGGPGAGQHAKLVNQTLIAGNMVGVCEALLYAHRAGLEPGRGLESVASGAAGSWSLSNLGPRMIRGDFAPGFTSSTSSRTSASRSKRPAAWTSRPAGAGAGPAAVPGAGGPGPRAARERRRCHPGALAKMNGVGRGRRQSGLDRFNRQRRGFSAEPRGEARRAAPRAAALRRNLPPASGCAAGGSSGRPGARSPATRGGAARRAPGRHRPGRPSRAGGDEAALVVVDQLGHAADVGHDRQPTAQHRLDHRQRVALEPRRQNQARDAGARCLRRRRRSRRA